MGKPDFHRLRSYLDGIRMSLREDQNKWTNGEQFTHDLCVVNFLTDLLAELENGSYEKSRHEELADMARWLAEGGKDEES